MGTAVTGRATRIAGRERERALLGEAIQGASTNQPRALFVHGEAGVGKTRLVAEAAAEAEELGFAVLWGRCVRFGAASSPYAPIAGALEGWLTAGDGPAREEAIADLEHLGEMLDDERQAGRVLKLIERVVGRIAARSPVLLVVDDLQWADITSLDVLAYLVAGFANQPMALLGTYRDVGLVDGHPLHGWLADLRRLPSVSDLRLARLRERETREQVDLLLDGHVHETLAQQVHARSGGNPYLTELLVRDLDPGATTLPPGLSNQLREVLLAGWHRLSEHTRDVVVLLAVGGRPYRYDELVAVAEGLGTDPAVVTAGLAEATHAGVVAVDDQARYWFRHPLLAEVLTDGFLPGEAEPLHAGFVAVLEGAETHDEAEEMRRLVDLAIHHEHSGHPDPAFRYSLLAAEYAARLQGHPEQTTHLRRAVALLPQVSPQVLEQVGGEVAVLERAAYAAGRSGDGIAAFDLVSRASALVDRHDDPLTASRLLVEWAQLAFLSGRTASRPLGQLIDAVEWSAGHPDSEEYAGALAVLAEAEAWAGLREQSARHAEEAVAAARRSGSASALSTALSARAFARLREESSGADIEESFRLAKVSGDPRLIAGASIDRVNYLEERGRIHDVVPVEADGFAVAAATGLRGWRAMFAGLAALDLMRLGRLHESRDWLREALAARADGVGGAGARQAAATYAIRVGRMREAADHLARLRELVPEYERQVGLAGPSLLAEFHLAEGQPDLALRVIESTLAVHAVTDPRAADLMLLWAARAAGALVTTAEDDGNRRLVAGARDRLDQLVSLRESFEERPFVAFDGEDLLQPAYGALFAAERAGCLHAETEEGCWELAAQACRRAGLRWDEAGALLRRARALPVHSRDLRAEVLREAHRLADEIDAVPLRQQVEALARAARVSLRRPVLPGDGMPVQVQRLAGLTRRELEVLAHLVAGRSYSEIARALFISEKTVSVHVSNLLRKTGTANRVDAAAFAVRHGIAAED